MCGIAIKSCTFFFKSTYHFIRGPSGCLPVVLLGDELSMHNLDLDLDLELGLGLGTLHYKSNHIILTLDFRASKFNQFQNCIFSSWLYPTVGLGYTSVQLEWAQYFGGLGVCIRVWIDCRRASMAQNRNLLGFMEFWPCLHCKSSIISLFLYFFFLCFDE